MILDQYGRPAIRAGGYEGAVDSRNRKKNALWRSLPFDEDRVVGQHDLDVLRRECLDMRRNNAIVAGVVERFADHVVGPQGIMPQAKTEDPAWNEEAEAFWSEWSKIADFRRRVNLRELQRLAVQSRLLMGDCGFVMIDNGQLQPVEAMRIADPARDKPDSVVNGVRLTPEGIPAAYYVHPRDKNGVVDAARFDVVRADNFIFCSRPMRIDQIRGIPELAPVLNAITDFGRLQENTLTKSVLDSMMAWAVKKHGGAGNLANLGPRGYSDDGGSGQKFERFEPNTVHYLEPDEDIQSLASNTPNPQYVAFCEMTLRIIASALCIPYEFLLLDFKGGSFSASRAALMTTYRTFSMWQNWLIESFLQRLWNWRIAKAIKRGELPPAPVDKRGYSTWYKVRWTTPRYDWIDPQAEAIGNIYNVALGVDSVSDVVATKGKDVEDVLMQKQKDLITAARRVKETNDAFAALGIDDRAVLENFIQVKVPPGINRAPAPAAEISVDDGEDDET